MRRVEWLLAFGVVLAACGSDGGGGAPGGAAGSDGAAPPDDARAADARSSDDSARDSRAPDGGAADAAEVDARATDARAAHDADPAPDAAPPEPVAIPLPPGDYPLRDCDVVVRHVAPDAARVRLAGEHTGWADAPLDLERQGGAWQIRLSPGPRLAPGARYAYKLIVDDRWRVDPEAPLRKWDGDCINSAFEMPACDAGPELRGNPIATRDGVTTATLDVRAALDGALPERLFLALDGVPLPAAAIRAEAGRVTVTLDALPAGRHVLDARAVDARQRAAAPLSLPFWVEARPFDWRTATLYMIVIDRFANGDRDADRPVGEPVQYPADWHGGDLWGALAVMRSGYFESMGVDALWLSPVNTQTGGHFSGRDDGGARRFAAYHGYWPVKAREVDPRFGGDAALRAFVDEAHRRGIRVLLDLINNQVHEEHEYFRAHPTWFRTGCVCGIDPGCGWSERPFDCLFAPYLPDINWRDAGAERQFIDDALFWIDAFGVDGFRVDAVKHVESNSIYDLRAALEQRYESGGTRVVMLGETAVGEGDRFDDGCGEQYGSGYAWIDAYTGPRGLDGQFDFPTHHRLQWGLLTGQDGFDVIERAVRDLETRYRPDALHVRFLGSHDSSRMASRAALDPARDCRWQGGGECALLAAAPGDEAVYRRLERAFTLLLTLPGIPLLYYGDEIAMAGGNDPDNRRDMMWDGALSAVANGVAMPAARQIALRERVATLSALRRRPAFRGGRTPLVVEPDLYVYTRHHEGDLAIVALNRGGAVADRLVPAPAGVRALRVATGEAQVAVEGANLRLSLPAGGAAVLIPE